MRSRAQARRARLLIVAIALTIGAIGAGGGILAARGSGAPPGTGTGGDGPSTTTTTTEPATTTSRPPTTTTATTQPPQIGTVGAFGVATTSLTVTVPGLPATDGTLPTTVWYPQAQPAQAGTNGGSAGGALRDRPLLVFSQGYKQAVTAYQVLLDAWASAGYVVAGPTYPHTVPSVPTTLDRADIVHHPTDLRAVLSSLLAASQTPASPLYGKIDPSEIGLVGQSDGGDVSLAATDSSCCRISTFTIKALAVLSGAEYRHFGGTFFDPSTPPGPPVLAVQGDHDTVNVAACSTQFYDAAPPPKYYLDLLGGTHLLPYEQSGSYEQAVASVTTDFFDAELAGLPTRLPAMTHDGNVPGVATLTSSATAPTPPGYCFTTTTKTTKTTKKS